MLKNLVRVAGFEPDTVGVRSQRDFHAALGSTRNCFTNIVKLFQLSNYYFINP
jgi:hypothetical protein